MKFHLLMCFLFVSMISLGSVSLFGQTTGQQDEQSAADDLLDSLSGGTSKVKINGAEVKKERHLRQVSADMNDPFQRQLFAQIETTDNLSYDLKAWTNHIFAGEYNQAAHLWTAIQDQIPESFRHSAEAGYLYSLWHLNLPQTFFLQLTKYLSKPAYSNSAAELALEFSITKDLTKASAHAKGGSQVSGQDPTQDLSFDTWVMNNAFELTPAQEELIANLDSKRPIARVLKARILLRKGEKAEAALNSLSGGSPLRIYLSQTAALAHARRHDLIGAAKILKAEEETIQSRHDPILLAQHYLTVARLLYQAGQLKNAQTYYEKIPNSAPQYVSAREEMMWTLLRLGDTSRLRGELETLSKSVFNERFAPELYMVRAISNLKMCYYGSVESDFDHFSKSNAIWAKKIDQALSSQNPPAPPDQDMFSDLATNSLKQLQTEKQRLTQLAQESIGATLPAVGPQKHWKEAENEIDVALNFAVQGQASEFRRQWTNDRAMLSEAIHKMRFVKVEYLNQVRKFSADSGKPLDKSSLVADSGNAIPNLKKEPNQLSFPVDEVIWPDELFKIRSTAQSRCMTKSGASK